LTLLVNEGTSFALGKV